MLCCILDVSFGTAHAGCLTSCAVGEVAEVVQAQSCRPTAMGAVLFWTGDFLAALGAPVTTACAPLSARATSRSV